MDEPAPDPPVDKRPATWVLQATGTELPEHASAWAGHTRADEAPTAPEAGGTTGAFEWDPSATPAFATEVEPVVMLPERYTWRGLLGAGGMGEVHRVRDHVLERDVALKAVHARLAGLRGLRAFRDEAQLTAGLQHPGIVPIHDLGELPDGRLFYTMPVIPGQPLSERIHNAHKDGVGIVAPVRRQLVDLVLRVAEAVGHAHARGVVHRDLKPSNVMVGGLGQVRVLDWGLARHVGTPGVAGRVSGSPSWMAPEQARGDASIGAATDVWALGAILAAAITGGPPYPAHDVHSARAQLLGDLQPPPPPYDDPETTSLWTQVCRALSPNPTDRHPDAGAFAQALADWRDGVARRRQAMAEVAAARRHGDDGQNARNQAIQISSELRARTGSGDEDEDALAHTWDLEDRHARLVQQATDADDRLVASLRRALQASPDLDEARHLLADHYQARHAEAEAEGAHREADRWERELRTWDRGRHAGWLAGNARITLRTEPAGAEVYAARLVEQGRRLVEQAPVRIGTTPLQGMSLGRGNWVVTLRAAGCAEVRLPLHLRRGEHIGAPGDPASEPLRLPRLGALEPDEVYLPPGWAICGGADPVIDRPLPRRRLFFPALIVRRHPMRHRDLLDWLARRIEAGNGDRAWSHVPRSGPARAGQVAQPAYGLQDGRPILLPDADGDLWDPDWPAFLVSWHDARAIAADIRAESGLPWRLVGELEWARMARGPAGSVYPWGTDQLAPSWCRMRSSKGGTLPAKVDEHPLDISVFGIRGLAGNVMEWCAEDYPSSTPVDDAGVVRHLPAGSEGEGQTKNVRGGAFGFPKRSCRATLRRTLTATRHYFNCGFRLVRDPVDSDFA